MDFEALIPFALLLVPGALAQYFYERLRPGTKVDSEFQRVFHSFLYGWPVLMANWLVVKALFSLEKDFNAIATLFGDIWFFVVYFGCSVLFAFLWSCSLVLLRKPANSFFSRASKVLKQPVILPELPWDTLFLHNNTQAIEVCTPDGGEHKGFVVSSASDPESGELLLAHLDIIKDHPECFTEVTRIHVNTQSGVVVRELALDTYLAKVRQKENEISS